jgi:hypothetical protein
MLIAVGLDPDTLSDVDTAEPDWHLRALAANWVVSDVVAARSLPREAREAKVFRVIADSCLDEIRALTASDVTVEKPSQP